MQVGELLQYPAQQHAVPASAIREPAKAREIGYLEHLRRNTAGETGHSAVKVLSLIGDVVEEIEYMLAELKRDSVGARAKTLVQVCVALEHPGVCEHDRHVAQRPRVAGLQQLRGWIDGEVAGRALPEHTDADRQSQHPVERRRVRGRVASDIFDAARSLRNMVGNAESGDRRDGEEHGLSKQQLHDKSIRRESLRRRCRRCTHRDLSIRHLGL
jgi:hypothetical protein